MISLRENFILPEFPDLNDTAWVFMAEGWNNRGWDGKTKKNTSAFELLGLSSLSCYRKVFCGQTWKKAFSHTYKPYFVWLAGGVNWRTRRAARKLLSLPSHTFLYPARALYR